jgi:hypothetical protein
MFASKAGTYPFEAAFKVLHSTPLQALPTNIRLGWKGLPVTNTLDCYEHLLIAATKSLSMQAFLG